MIPYILTDSSLTVVLNGKPLSMSSSNPSFENAKVALTEERFEDLELMFDKAKAVVVFAAGNIDVRSGQVFYMGVAVHNHVVGRILDFIRDGLPYEPLIKFLDKLMNNPSRRAVTELYSFLEHQKMPLTSTGNFLAYKSVRQDWTDHHSGRFSNIVGSVHAMTRNTVCDDINIGCSYGFHAGSLEYAKGFGSSDSRLLIVEVDPMDVVSVPLDCNSQKLRTAKYKVVGEFERPLDEPLNDRYDDSCDDSCDDGGDDSGDDSGDDGGEALTKHYAKPFVSEATRQKLRDNALRQRRNGNGKFI